jgi:hypothetical protein
MLQSIRVKINNISYKLGFTKYWWIHEVILVVLFLSIIALVISFPLILLLPVIWVLYTMIREKIVIYLYKRAMTNFVSKSISMDEQEIDRMDLTHDPDIKTIKSLHGEIYEITHRTTIGEIHARGLKEWSENIDKQIYEDDIIRLTPKYTNNILPAPFDDIAPNEPLMAHYHWTPEDLPAIGIINNYKRLPKHSKVYLIKDFPFDQFDIKRLGNIHTLIDNSNTDYVNQYPAPYL